MRPHDIAVLIKIIALGDSRWNLSFLAHSLVISISEVSESLNRSRIARLIDADKKKVHRQSLMEFLEYGIKYAFPQQPGGMVRGLPAAYSHPLLKQKFISEMNVVWQDDRAETIGLAIEPLYAKQIDAAKNDEQFYYLLSLIDLIRVGKLRESAFAIEELKKQLEI